MRVLDFISKLSSHYCLTNLKFEHKNANNKLQSNIVNPTLLLTGNLLFGQNFSTPKFFIIPLHVSV